MNKQQIKAFEEFINKYGLSASFTQEEKRESDIFSEQVLKGSLKKAGKYNHLKYYLFVKNNSW